MSKTKLRAEELDRLLQDSETSLEELRQIKTELRQMGRLHMRSAREDRKQMEENVNETSTP